MGLHVEELRVIADDGAALVGSLTLPSSNQPAPLVVAVHGASGGTRAAQLVAHLSQFLPRFGVGVLAFDRRGDGASGGDARQRTIARLSGDVAAWLDAVTKLPRLDDDRVGLWAHSQGGWIAPTVAAAESRVAFLAAVSPCALTPARQMNHALRERLRATGHPDESVRAALALREAVDECYRRGEVASARAAALIDSARGEPWFEHAFLPNPADPADDPWGSDLDFDATPALSGLDVAVLVLFGASDRWVPVQPTLDVWRATVRGPLSAEVFAEAGHSLTTSFDDADPEERGPVHSGYEPALETWLTAVLAD